MLEAGHVITIMIFVTVQLLSILGIVLAIKGSVRVMDTRLTFQDRATESIQLDLKKLNQVVTDLALQSQRMTNIELIQIAQGKRLDEAIAASIAGSMRAPW